MSRWSLNKRQAAIVAALLVGTFIGAAFGLPALEKALAPSPATVSPRTVKSSVDIVAFKNDPGAYIYQDENTSGLPSPSPYHGHYANLLASFSFTPVGTFQEVDAIKLTFVYQAGVYPLPTILLARINMMAGFTPVELCNSQDQLNFTGVHVCSTQEEPGNEMLVQNLSPGVNRMEIVPGNSAPFNDMILNEVRLTILYTSIL